MDIQGTNPLSNKFYSTAIQNMQTNIASVKSGKDVKGGEEAEEDHEPQDAVQLTQPQHAPHAHGAGEPDEVTEEDHEVAAENSGDLAQAKRSIKRREDDEEAEVRAFHERAAMTQQSAPQAVTRLPGEENKLDVHAIETDRDRIRRVRSDVPEEIFSAAGQIVQGQMVDETRPSQGLTQLKSISEPGVLHTERAEFVPMMDIHDTHNQPLPFPMEDGAALSGAA